MCGPDFMCTPGCAVDSDCMDGERCIAGQCLASGCATDADCPGGQRCRSGQCQTVECTTDADCAGGRICTDGRCQQTSCFSGAQCPPGYVCVAMMCQPGHGEAPYCADHWDNDGDGLRDCLDPDCDGKACKKKTDAGIADGTCHDLTCK